MDGHASAVRARSPVPHAMVAVPTITGLSRPRLLAALDPVRTTRTGLVVAAAGMGKTTLAGQWAATLDVPAAWCRLHPSAAEPERLIQWLWQAMAPFLPRAGVEPPAGAAELALLLEERSEPLLLVVDDLHTVVGTTGEAELEQVFLQAPPSLRVLLCSRQLPSFNLARSELPPPVILTGNDLRFRTWEVDGLFRSVHREPMAAEDVAALTRYTEGWAAALQLFHLTTRGAQPGERRRAVHALAGRSRYAQDYLSAQVLAELPSGTQEFLRRTCVFDVLTADRCDTLLGTTGSQRTLRDLERRQALTTSEDGGETFTYHDVLRRHLEMALREDLGPAAVRVWHRRAAEVLEAEGAVVEALRARCRAEDWAGVRRLLGEHGERIFGVGVHAEDNRWTQMLPSWLAESDPWCRLAEARRLLADGRLAAADAASREAERLFVEPLGRTLCEDVRRSVAAWRGGPPAPRPFWGDLLRAATRHDPLSVVAPIRALDDRWAVLAHGLALVLAGDLRSGRLVLAGAVSDADDEPEVALAAELVLATLAEARNTSSDGDPPFDRVQREAERRGMTWLARLATGLAVATGGSRSRGEITAIVEDLERREDGWAAALVEAGAAMATTRAGRPDPDALEALALRFRRLDAGVLEVWARAVHSLQVATLGLPGAAATARAAEAAARSAAVPGAAAFAYAALAATSTSDRAELLALARSTATAAGLGCRPWAWSPLAEGWAAWADDSARVPHVDAPSGGVPSGVVPFDVVPSVDVAPLPLELTCLGRFRLVVEDRVMDLGVVRPRARAALKFLAVHAGRPVHREIIADALWGDLHPDAAMHNLQVSLSSLRGALEPGARGRRNRLLVRDGEAYMLVLPAGARCDVVELDRALAEAGHARAAGDEASLVAALSRAVDAYGGDLFPEEGPAEWVVGFREIYRSRAAEAAASLAELELARGDVAAAVTAAQRATQIDEYRDDAWRVLITALRRSGEPAAAQRAVHRYAQVLQTLGLSGATVSPDPGALPPSRTPEPGGAHRMARRSSPLPS